MTLRILASFAFAASGAILATVARAAAPANIITDRAEPAVLNEPPPVAPTTPARGFGGRGASAVTGPPAPVPPEVAIPRPTAAEVAQMNAELKRLVEQDNSPAGELMKKYGAIVPPIPMPRPNSAIVPVSGGVRTSRHAAFVDAANKENFDLLFEGDSITDWWTQNDAKKAVYNKYFGDLRVANFAVAGDTTQGVLWGLQNGEGKGHKPRGIMLLIGTNNTGANTGAEIAEGVGAVVLENRHDFPDAKILLLAIFPRGTPNDASRAKIEEANKLIAKLDDRKHVLFMDIGNLFVDPDSKALLPGVFQTDNLHPTEKGYDIWGDAVIGILSTFLK